MELWRKKNTATRIVFPIRNTDGGYVSGAAGLDSEYVSFSTSDHAGAAPSFADCTHEATEIGTTGFYYLDIDAGEINADYTLIHVKTTTSLAINQIILIRTSTDDLTTMIVPPTSGTVADSVWDELAADHSTPSTFGKYLGGAPAGATLSADIASAKVVVDLIEQIHKGKRKIDNNQLILYKSDNTTVVATFNLFDANGDPAESGVVERVFVS